MNDAKLQLDAGNLSAAENAALAAVKANPTNEAARRFLFELSCFSGNWERAEKQLDVIGHQDANAMVGSLIYKQNLKAERDRIKVFGEGLRPESAMKFPDYVEDLLRANGLVRQGHTAEARQLLDDIEEKRPAFPCTVNGEHVEDFRDFNDLTMCVFEVLIKDSYVWVPFEHVQKIEFMERKSLKDVYWLQAEIEWINGTNGEMFLPSLYVNSFKHDDDAIRLGRAVDWRDAGDEIFVGEGTRLYSFGGKQASILDLKTIEFDR